MWLDSKAVNCPQKWGNFRKGMYFMLLRHNRRLLGRLEHNGETRFPVKLQKSVA